MTLLAISSLITIAFFYSVLCFAEKMGENIYRAPKDG
jgi:hypothetical protein